MRHIVIDVEADNLLLDATKIHCIAVRDAEAQDLLAPATPEAVPQALKLIEEAELVIGHNLLGFDRPIIGKLLGVNIPLDKCWDTVVVSRYLWSDLAEKDYASVRLSSLAGGHSLEAWGTRLGIPKLDFGDDPERWARWTPEMQTYCEGDTSVALALYRLECKKLQGVDRSVSLRLEHEVSAVCAEMYENGWPFDYSRAVDLLADLTDKAEAIRSRLASMVPPWYGRDGKPWVPKRDNAKTGLVAGVPVQKIKLIEFNPNSRPHIYRFLMGTLGWKPDKRTETGQPEVSDETLKAFGHPVADDLAAYLMLSKRISALEGKRGWLSLARLDSGGNYRMHPSTISCGTVTHRASHSKPNIAQVPRVGTPYGKECRELFTVPDSDWRIVGADMDGLELRCLAHYLHPYDDGEYAEAVDKGSKASGTDPHTVNQRALGWPDEPQHGRITGGRDTAKTWFYAWLYGAGDEKLGSIEYPLLTPQKQKKAGRAARQRFETGLAALGKLKKAVDAAVEKRGTLTLIDRRVVPVRHKHAAVNTLLQGTGSVLCKAWISRSLGSKSPLREVLGEPHFRRQWSPLGWIHDEIQVAATETWAEYATKEIIQAATEVGYEFNFRIPLRANAVIGTNWAETH